jgi:hypothetical protein
MTRVGVGVAGKFAVETIKIGKKNPPLTPRYEGGE